LNIHSLLHIIANVRKRIGMEEHDSEELTPLTNFKSMTHMQQKKSYKSVLKSSTHEDPNLSVWFNGCGSKKLEVACE